MKDPQWYMDHIRLLEIAGELLDKRDKTNQNYPIAFGDAHKNSDKIMPLNPIETSYKKLFSPNSTSISAFSKARE